MKRETKLPMLPNRVFTEQINIKVDSETKRKAQLLKGHGVDTAEIFRANIQAAIDEAFQQIDSAS